MTGSHHRVRIGAVSVGLVVLGYLALPAGRVATPGPATRYVAVSGSDGGNSCRDPLRPCASLAAAYRSAHGGDTVRVAGGSYGTQRIGFDPSKTTAADVVMTPARGAVVRLQDLLIKGRHVTIQGMTVRDVALNVNTEVNTLADLTAQDITLRRLDGRNFEILSASDVRIQGGDWGPASACGGPYGGGNNAIRQYPGGPPPANVTIDGATIHDIRSYDLTACHTEGLAIFAGRNIVVRNSRFYGNDLYDFFVQANSGADPIRGITVENSWLAHTTRQAGAGEGFWAAEFDGVHSDLHLRHNSAVQEVLLSSPGPYTDTDVTGNIGVLTPGACRLPGVRYAYNVWRRGRCAPTDVTLRGGRLPFVRATSDASLDYHLTGGRAVDLVPPAKLTVRRDIDGDRRPIGRGGDAGSDERRRGPAGRP